MPEGGFVNKEYWAAEREARIMQRCQDLANQIIAELGTSSGDHGEDIEPLIGFIEVWECLRLAHEESMSFARYHHEHRKEAS